MTNPSPRSPRDTAAQLAIILLLIAILIGAIVLLDRLVTSHANSEPAVSTRTGNYSCCAVEKAIAVYRPGDSLHLNRSRTAFTGKARGARRGLASDVARPSDSTALRPRHATVMPPSTATSAPVTAEAAGEQSQAIDEATSIGSSSRPKGWLVANDSAPSRA